MIVSVQACSYDTAKKNKDLFLSFEDVRVISIRVPDSDPIFEAEDPKVLSLVFHDISDREAALVPIIGTDQKELLIPMSHAQARQVVDFVDKWIHSSDYHRVIVHCNAGVARSGAVAEFIQEAAGIPHQRFVEQNPQINPNKYVKRLLRQVAEEKRLLG